MFIASANGNVGIGTTSPSEKLEVQGNAKIGNDNTTSVSFLIARKNSNQAQVNYFIPAAESPNYQWIEGGYWTGEQAGVSVANDSGKPYYESYVPAGGFKAFGFINQTTSGSSFTSTAITSSMVLYQGGNIALAPVLGNVGIGTYNPNTKLNIQEINSGTEGLIITNWNSVNTLLLGSDSSTGGGKITLRTNGGTSNVFISSYGISYFNGGNVGIGTDNPETKLQIQTTSNSDQELLRLTVVPANSSGAKPKAILGFYTPAETNTTSYTSGRITSKFDIAGYANSRVTIESLDSGGNFIETLTAKNGNVGIGTTSPTQKLDISAGTNLNLGVSQLSLDNFSNEGIGITFSRTSSDDDLSAIGIIDSDKLGLFSRSGIIFATSGSSTYSATSEKMRITENGNVGIGTTNPVGNANANARVLQVNGGGANPPEIKAGGDNAEISIAGGSGASYLWATGNYPLVIATNASEKMRITSAGNVGIGTSTPTGRLTVAPYNTVNSSSIEFTDADNAVISSYYSQTFAVDNTNTQSGRQFVFAKGGKGYGTQTKTMMVIDADSGNVGIGTTNPSWNLDVVSTSATTARIKSTSASGAARLIINPEGAGAGSTGDGLIFFDVNSTAWIAGVDKSDSSKFKIANDVNGDFSTNNYFNITTGGNVGIGTDSPVQTLDVFKNTNSVNAISVRNPSTGASAHAGLYIGNDVDNNSGGIVVFGSSSTYSSPYNPNGTYLYSNKPGGVAVVAESSAPVYIATNNNIRLYVTSGGNVGIGTTNPTELVDAYKSFNGDVVCQISNPNTGTSAAAQFFASNGTNRTQFFHTGTSYTGPGVLTSAAGLGGLYNTTVQGLAFLAANASGTIKFATGTGNDERMRITSGGNVGIGTTSPNAKLQVVGPSLTVNDENTYGLWVSETGDDTKAIILGYDQGIDAGIITAVDKATAWKNLILQPNLGGVGVGVTSPSYKLHVSGAIAIENQGTTTIETTTFSGSLTTNTNIASVPTASFKAAFFDYYVASGSVNMRAGTVMAVHNNSTSRYTDTSTADIGTTAAVDFSTSIVAGSLVLTANISSGTWEVKTAYRAL